MTSTTTFACVDDQYVLTVDSTKEAVTTAWLENQHCFYDRYFRNDGTVKFVLFHVASNVVDAIAAKYPLVDQAAYDYEEELVFETPAYRYCVCTDSSGYEAFATVTTEGVTLHISTHSINYSAFVAATNLQVAGATERQVAEAAWNFYVASYAS